jgi:hypothetical protein
MKKYTVTLSEDERKTLGELTSKGTQKSQKILVQINGIGATKTRRFRKSQKTGLASVRPEAYPIL